MLHTHSTTNAPLINRTMSIVLALVALCFCVLLFWNAVADGRGRPIGWQLRVVNSLGEMLFDTIAHVYDRWEQQ